MPWRRRLLKINHDWLLHDILLETKVTSLFTASYLFISSNYFSPSTDFFCSCKHKLLSQISISIFTKESDDWWKAVCAAVHLFKLSIICASCSVWGDFCSGSVCRNRRSGTGTSKTGWEAVCRRHVPHRSSYGRVSTQSDTSYLRRLTSLCRPCFCHTIQAVDGGIFSVNHHWQGGRFPYNVFATDGGNRNSGAASHYSLEYLSTWETCESNQPTSKNQWL